MRAAKLAARSAALDANLFILNPLLRASLIGLRKLSYDVASCRLYKVDPQHTYTLPEFCDKQAQQKKAIEEQLEG